MGCGASNRTNGLGILQNLQPIHAKLFIDGLDVNVITSKTVHSTLTTVLGDNDCRFDVKVTSKPSIYTLKIIPKMVDDDLQKITESKVLRMVYNQIRIRAHTGALYLGHGGCWIVNVKSEEEDKDSTDNLDINRYYENILIKEVFTEAWIYTIPDRSEELNLEKLTKILNWEKLRLELNQATIASIYEQLPKLKTNNCILVKDFLSKIRSTLLETYAINNPEKEHDWRQMWSQKSGNFYFNLRSGICQYAEPRA